MTNKRVKALELALDRLIAGAWQVLNSPTHVPYQHNLTALARMAQEILEEGPMTIQDTED